jgi:hypothetical protein
MSSPTHAAQTHKIATKATRQVSVAQTKRPASRVKGRLRGRDVKVSVFPEGLGVNSPSSPSKSALGLSLTRTATPGSPLAQALSSSSSSDSPVSPQSAGSLFAKEAGARPRTVSDSESRQPKVVVQFKREKPKAEGGSKRPSHEGTMRVPVATVRAKTPPPPKPHRLKPVDAPPKRARTPVGVASASVKTSAKCDRVSQVHILPDDKIEKPAEPKDKDEKKAILRQASVRAPVFVAASLEVLPHGVPAKETIDYNALSKTFRSKDEVIDTRELRSKLDAISEPFIHISFVNCTLSDEALDVIGKLTNLQTLELVGCSFIGKDEIRLSEITLGFLSHSLRLQILKIISPRAIVHLTHLNPTALGDLQVLDVSHANQNPEVEHLLKLGRLKSLSLKGASQLTDRALLRLAELQSLQQLVLSGCTALTGAGLTGFAQQRVHAVTTKKVSPITYLALDGMLKLTDRDLAFLSHMKGLQALSLRHCPDLFGTTLSKLPATVKVLDLSRCRNLRVDQLKENLKHKLRSINLQDCPFAGERLVQSLKEARIEKNGEILWTKVTSPGRVRTEDVDWLTAEFEKLSLQVPEEVFTPPPDNICVIL